MYRGFTSWERLAKCGIAFTQILSPEGAFGVRQLAAAFENGPKCLFFEDSPESGSKLPHSEGALRARKAYGIGNLAGINFCVYALVSGLITEFVK
jgi:hypothetical protein